MKRFLVLAAALLMGAATATAATKATSAYGVTIRIGWYLANGSLCDSWVEYTTPDGSIEYDYPGGPMNHEITIATGSAIELHFCYILDARAYFSVTGLGEAFNSWYDEGYPITYDKGFGPIYETSAGPNGYFEGPGIAIMIDEGGYHPE